LSVRGAKIKRGIVARTRTIGRKTSVQKKRGRQYRWRKRLL